MYEQKNIRLAEMCHTACVAAKNRPSQRPDTERPVEPGDSLDGQWVANPTQSAACEGQYQGITTPHMAGICPTRNRHSAQQEEPCETERLETVGDTASVGRATLHPESKADLAIVPRPTGEVNTENVMRLLEYQQYRCALTGRKLTPHVAALDHIVPIRFDGEHIIANVQVLHKDVNRAKGSLTNAEFIRLCEQVVSFLKTKKNRPGSPLCGDLVTVGAVDWNEDVSQQAQTPALL